MLQFAACTKSGDVFVTKFVVGIPCSAVPHLEAAMLLEQMLRAKMCPVLGPALHSCWILGIPQFEPQLRGISAVPGRTSWLSVFKYTTIQIHGVYAPRSDKNPLLAYQRGVFCNPSECSEADEGGEKPSGKHMWNNHQPASLWREGRANEEESAGAS